jgi:hypothetical protein
MLVAERGLPMLKDLVAFAGALSLASTVTAQIPSQEELISTLRAGAPTARAAAIDRVARIPPDQRGEDLWLALVDELQRLTRENDARDDLTAAGKEVPASGVLGGVEGYLPDLITVVGEWRDVRVLPALISAPGGGMIITEPILRFGDTAVPLLIDAARRGRRSQLGGSLLALQWLTEGFTNVAYNIPPANLSPQNREAILQLARDLLRPKAVSWSALPTVAALALATKDPDLTQQVELLAREPGLVSQVTGLVDAQSIDLIRNGIAARVKAHNDR